MSHYIFVVIQLVLQMFSQDSLGLNVVKTLGCSICLAQQKALKKECTKVLQETDISISYLQFQLGTLLMVSENPECPCINIMELA